MSNLNAGHSFVAGVISRGKRISMLAFEVANTIAKGVNLLQSLSEENINFLKKDVFYSEGVQKLVSKDIKELLSIAAADKRSVASWRRVALSLCFNGHCCAGCPYFHIAFVLISLSLPICRDELDVFSREVTRFGDLCKDPQWHNLGRYFSK